MREGREKGEVVKAPGTEEGAEGRSTEEDDDDEEEGCCRPYE